MKEERQKEIGKTVSGLNSSHVDRGMVYVDSKYTMQCTTTIAVPVTLPLHPFPTPNSVLYAAISHAKKRKKKSEREHFSLVFRKVQNITQLGLLLSDGQI